LRPSNGPELTGADPHAGKYSAREVATSGAAPGAAWSWAARIAHGVLARLRALARTDRTAYAHVAHTMTLPTYMVAK
jgi:hypothetical protein